MAAYKGTANIQYDQEGDAYFMLGGEVYYLSEFYSDGFSGTAYLSLSAFESLAISVDPENESVFYERAVSFSR